MLRATAEASEKSNLALRSRIQAADELNAQLQARIRSADLDREEHDRQLEAAKSQRSMYLWETKRLESALLESDRRVGLLEKEKIELGKIVERGHRATESFRGECERLKKELKRTATQTKGAKAELEAAERCQKQLEEENARLANELLACRENPVPPIEARIELAGMQENYAESDRERSALKAENLNLRLHLAVAREGLADSSLHQENQLLRGVLERTNDQLRGLLKRPKGAQIVALNKPFRHQENRLRGVFARWAHPVFRILSPRAN